MARVICSIPTASELINGVRFLAHKLGAISEEIEQEVADAFLAVPGFFSHEAVKADLAAGKTPEPIVAAAAAADAAAADAAAAQAAGAAASSFTDDTASSTGTFTDAAPAGAPAVDVADPTSTTAADKTAAPVVKAKATTKK